jgi:hypothetical protein
VLGAKVSEGSPSLMLKDRLDKAIEIYNQNKNIKIIASGDSQNPNVYDEVTVMYNYLVNNGVNHNNIIKDNYGISTYDSIVRMKDIVKEEKTIIVTQKYHLSRSVYTAKELDINAIGISSREYKYFGQLGRDIREILARVKDYVFVKLNNNYVMQAGNYELNNGRSLEEILTKINNGEVVDNSITVTFVEGKRITNYVKVINKKFGYSEDEILKVLSDKAYLHVPAGL